MSGKGKADKKDDKKDAKAGDKKDDKKDAKAGDKKDAKDDKKDEKGKKGEKKVAKAKKVKEMTEEEMEAAKPRARRKARKARFRSKLESLIQEYKNVLVVRIDNVGSNQMQQVRIALRGQAVVLMGKNTLMRKILKDNETKNPKLAALRPFIKGNVGFVFTNGDLQVIRETIAKNKVPAAARSGTFAPSDVIIPPGVTGLDPGQTSFFQALNIATKISKGSIEISDPVHLIKKGDKISASAVALLTKLDIKPFFYGILVETVYEDGSVYDAEALDIKPDDLLERFFTGVRVIAALSLRIGYPTLASVPHSIANGFKYLLAASLATNYTFPEAEPFKAYLANPDAFKKADAPKADDSKAATGSKSPAKAAEPEPEEEGDMGFSLFD